MSRFNFEYECLHCHSFYEEESLAENCDCNWNNDSSSCKPWLLTLLLAFVAPAIGCVTIEDFPLGISIGSSFGMWMTFYVLDCN